MSKFRSNRGNALTRHRRKIWLLETFGDGTTAECSLRISKRCTRYLTYYTITVDRFPIPGRDGGTYDRDNIRPACIACNSLDGTLSTPRARGR